MCSQNAGNVTSELLILNIFQGYPPTPLGTKYEPPRQNQNSKPMSTTKNISIFNEIFYQDFIYLWLYI